MKFLSYQILNLTLNKTRKERKINELNLSRTTNRLEATLLIVPDATQPPERAEWAAALKGRIVLDKSCLLREKGMVVAYKKRLPKGKIFITENFEASHPQITKLVLDSKNWKKANERSTAKVILRTSDEDDGNGSDGSLSFTKQELLEYIKKIDMKRSGMLRGSSK